MKGIQIVAIDPGETTGVAWGVFQRKHLIKGRWLSTLPAALTGGQILTFDVKCEDENAGAMEIMDKMRGLEKKGMALTDGKVLLVTDVAIESFILRERTMDPSLLSPVRVGAKVDALIYAGVLGSRSPELMPAIHWQGADIKSVITNDRLKQWKLWEPSVSPHRRDALRHLVHRVRMLINEGI